MFIKRSTYWQKRRKMAGMITGLDYGIGRIYNSLVEKGIANDTVFVFMSDNGGRDTKTCQK